MEKFVFKSVFTGNELFPDEIDNEMVTDQTHVDSIEDILLKYGYPQQVEGVYDDDDSEDVNPFNNFDFDIIDAYEQSLDLQLLEREEGKHVEDVERNEERQDKGDDDEERGTSEEEK